MTDWRISKGTLPSWLLTVAAATVLWPIIERLGNSIGDHYDAAQIVGMRYAVHVAVLAIVCAPLGLRSLAVTRHLPAQLARAACMFVMPASFTLAVSDLAVDGIWAVFWIAPVIVLVLGRRWLGEPCPPQIWLASLLAYGGALMMLAPRIEQPGTAAIWPVMMAVSFSLYVVLSRRLRDEWVGTSLFYTGAGAFAAVLPFMVARWQPLWAEDLAAIVCLGGAGLLLLLLLDRALQRAPTTLLAPFLYGSVAWQPVVDMVLGQRPALLEVSGGLVVLATAAALAVGVATARARP
jgi:drug/metabolite transporter (DMT)-like permease